MATFYFVKGDAVKLLKHHLEILLQYVPGSAIFLIDWLDYKGNNKITELRTILQRESQNS
jgi:hypothetical protein